MTRDGYSGSGPGAFTPDGCAVEVYERMPVGDEPDVIQRMTPAGASILELGCGAGRVTHPLVERGFTVTAVDESAEMLAKVHGARTVRSSIEELDLGERFDVVLLGSFLVHAPSDELAVALLATCARHVEPDGCVLLQREGASWHEGLPRVRRSAGGTVTVASSTEVEPGVRSVVVEYAFPDASWTHTFLSRLLSEGDLADLLVSAGLTFDSYLTEDLTWVRATPMKGLSLPAGVVPFIERPLPHLH